MRQAPSDVVSGTSHAVRLCLCGGHWNHGAGTGGKLVQAIEQRALWQTIGNTVAQRSAVETRRALPIRAWLQRQKCPSLAVSRTRTWELRPLAAIPENLEHGRVDHSPC